MNLQPVKSADGCRLRDPRTRAVLPNVSDVDAEPVSVDLDDPHWYRALQCGDIVVTEATRSPAAAPAPSAPAAPTLAPTPAADSTAAASTGSAGAGSSSTVKS